MRAYLFASLFLFGACRVDLPEYASDDSLIDSGVIQPDNQLPGDPPMLTTAQDPYDFGDVTVDASSSSLQVIVRNSGEEPSSVLAVSLTGANPDQFEIVVAGADDCEGRVLTAQETCVAEVQFHPSAAAPAAATLEVTAVDGGTVTVAVTGNGLTAGDLEITAGATLAFSTVEIQSMSATQTLTVHNTGGSATANLDTILSDEVNYTITSDGCEGSPLGANLSCDVVVRFDPSTVGSLPAQVSVRESVSVGVAASATGTGTARLAVTKTGNGTVVSTPAGISCAGAAACGQATFQQTPVQLTATSTDMGYAFDTWTGACAGETSSVCSVPLTVPLTSVGVTFRQLACIPDTIVCDDATSHYVDCDTTGDVEFEMQCPLGCASGMEKCMDVDPSNGVAAYLDMTATAPAVSFSGTSTLNTSTGVITNAGVSITVPQATSGGMRVFMFSSLSIAGNLRVSGTAPLVLLSNGAITITGHLDVSGDGGVAGPGPRTSGTACDGGNTGPVSPSPGGGGAGRANAGGTGGGTGTTAGGAFGFAFNDADLVPLQGGCSGGYASETSGGMAFASGGGGGGGSVQIVSRVQVSVEGTGKIDASGGGGLSGAPATGRLGGGGGGSGGGILIEAPQIILTGSGVILSTLGGGGAAAGNGSAAFNGKDGEDLDGDAGGGAALGGVNSPYASGGNGGTGTLGPTAGATGSSAEGGGGGGAAGWVRFNNASGTLTPQSGALIRSQYGAGVIGSRVAP